MYNAFVLGKGAAPEYLYIVSFFQKLTPPQVNLVHCATLCTGNGPVVPTTGPLSFLYEKTKAISIFAYF